MKVTLRPLDEHDAETSFRWRNDARVWQFTGNRPETEITLEIERDWIRNVLARTNEKRFAICIGDAQQYVGNVQLTNITSNDAEFHIFIGEVAAHGKGVGTQATQRILDYARDALGLQQVYLSVHPDNVSAIRAYEKCGFQWSPTDGTRLTYIRKLSP
jgi:RimJ/RimL family protein N-acetyltransferase